MNKTTDPLAEEVEYAQQRSGTRVIRGLRFRIVLGSNHRASMTLIAPIPADEPVVFATQARDVNSGSRIEARAVRAANELGVSATNIERLPFDLSVLDAGGVFINVDAANFGLLDRRLDWQALGITLPRGSDLAFRPARCGRKRWQACSLRHRFPRCQTRP